MNVYKGAFRYMLWALQIAHSAVFAEDAAREIFETAEATEDPQLIHGQKLIYIAEAKGDKARLWGEQAIAHRNPEPLTDAKIREFLDDAVFYGHDENKHNALIALGTDPAFNAQEVHAARVECAEAINWTLGAGERSVRA